MTLPFAAFISPGGGELLMIMLVLIMLFGAKDAPRILRSIQNALDKLQRTAADFRYRMMYGDLHQSNPHADEPYDVEADYPDDEEPAPDTEQADPEPLPTESESGTSEPRTSN